MEPVALPNKERASLLYTQWQVAQRIFEAYVQGCQDGLKLEGDWSLNVSSWQLMPRAEKETKE